MVTDSCDLNSRNPTTNIAAMTEFTESTTTNAPRIADDTDTDTATGTGLHDREVPICVDDHDNYTFVNNNVELLITSGGNGNESEQCESEKSTNLDENM